MVLFGSVVVEFSIWVDDEDFACWNANVLIANSIRVPVTQTTVERLLVLWEELPYVLETLDLKDLWLLEDHFSLE